MNARSYASHVQEIESFGLGLNRGAPARDAAVLRSWQRCIERHRLDPAATCEAYIVPEGQLRVHREESEPLIRIARSGLERLYQQLAGLQYVLLLADRHGITVDFLGHEGDADALRRAGLYLGSDWREDRAGTCAVGACLEGGEALIIHQSDHFDYTHTPLSCTAAPIYDHRGELAAVLDLSLLRSPESRSSQSLALHLVTSTARRIELAHLMERSRSDWVLRLSRSPDFLDVDPDAALTLDGAGRVRGMTQAAARLLAQAIGLPWAERRDLLGLPLERFFELDVDGLPSLLRHRLAQDRIVRARDGSILFAHAIEPQRGSATPVRDATPAPSATTTATASPVPQALRALSAGDAHLDALLHKAARLAPQRLPVMIQGETGAGKEYLARALHTASGRPGPFVAINCAAIPETLLESELFGYLPGTYTGGASRGKTGLVEAAHRGTLFLDEIGDMPLHLQAKLLRVLSESEITPLGARQPKPLDLRVISATHRPLVVLVDQGLFRQDLLFRLNAAQLSLPPLRQRQDLDALIDRLAEAQRPGLRPTPEARALLRAHGWPGNLRELHNALCHAAALSEGPCFGLEHLPETVLEASAGSPQTVATMLPRLPAPPLEPPPHVSEATDPEDSADPADPAMALERLLQRCQGNVSEAARLLGVSRSTIHRRIQRLALGERRVRWSPADGRD